MSHEVEPTSSLAPQDTQESNNVLSRLNAHKMQITAGVAGVAMLGGTAAMIESGTTSLFHTATAEAKVTAPAGGPQCENINFNNPEQLAPGMFMMPANGKVQGNNDSSNVIREWSVKGPLGGDQATAGSMAAWDALVNHPARANVIEDTESISAYFGQSLNALRSGTTDKNQLCHNLYDVLGKTFNYEPVAIAQYQPALQAVAVRNSSGETTGLQLKPVHPKEDIAGITFEKQNPNSVHSDFNGFNKVVFDPKTGNIYVLGLRPSAGNKHSDQPNPSGKQHDKQPNPSGSTPDHAQAPAGQQSQQQQSSSRNSSTSNGGATSQGAAHGGGGGRSGAGLNNPSGPKGSVPENQPNGQHTGKSGKGPSSPAPKEAKPAPGPSPGAGSGASAPGPNAAPAPAPSPPAPSHNNAPPTPLGPPPQEVSPPPPPQNETPAPPSPPPTPPQPPTPPSPPPTPPQPPTPPTENKGSMPAPVNNGYDN